MGGTTGKLMRELDLLPSGFRNVMGEERWNFSEQPLRGVFKFVA